MQDHWILDRFLFCFSRSFIFFPVCILTIIFCNSSYYIRNRHKHEVRKKRKKFVAIISIDNWAGVFSFFLLLLLPLFSTQWLHCNVVYASVSSQPLWNVNLRYFRLFNNNGDESWNVTIGKRFVYECIHLSWIVLYFACAFVEIKFLREHNQYNFDLFISHRRLGLVLVKVEYYSLTSTICHSIHFPYKSH